MVFSLQPDQRLGSRALARAPVSVLLSEFEDLVARGLKALIAEVPSLELVAADVPGSRMSQTLGHLRPQVAIVNYGVLRTVAEVSELASTHVATRLVVLANHPTPAECRQMLAFGATACLSKSTEERDVLSSIHLASRGLRVMPPDSAAAGSEAPVGPDLLTPREVDVLDLLQAGQSNAQIAVALHISVETVRTHARRIYRKLGVRTRRDLRAGR